MSDITFLEVTKQEFPLLKQYTPIIARVHGEHHPELAHVRDIFKAMNKKVKKEGATQVDLAAEFGELREITNNYTIPEDACGAYQMTYEILERADKAYHS